MKTLLSSILLGMFVIILTPGCEETHASNQPTGKPDYSIVDIKTESGSESAAAYFSGGKDQVVIFVPGAIFNKESWYFLAARLQKMDIASLSLDGKTPDVVLSSIKYLKEKGFKTIDLVGGSMGGAAVLNALDRQTDSNINKVIALAPAGGEPVKSGKIKKLFIVARHDSLGLYPYVKKLYENSPNPKKFVSIEGTAHAQRRI